MFFFGVTIAVVMNIAAPIQGIYRSPATSCAAVATVVRIFTPCFFAGDGISNHLHEVYKVERMGRNVGASHMAAARHQAAAVMMMMMAAAHGISPS